MQNVRLEDVCLSQASFDAFNEFSRRSALRLIREGVIDSRLIPDEQVTIMDDGQLKIWIVVSGVGEIAYFIPPRHWAWADGRN